MRLNIVHLRFLIIGLTVGQLRVASLRSDKPRLVGLSPISMPDCNSASSRALLTSDERFCRRLHIRPPLSEGRADTPSAHYRIYYGYMISGRPVFVSACQSLVYLCQLAMKPVMAWHR